MREVYGGTQTAISSLPVEAALKLLAADKVRIGWVTCCPSKQVALKSNFRCLGFGNITKTCSSVDDKPKECRRCRAEGHKST